MLFTLVVTFYIWYFLRRRQVYLSLNSFNTARYNSISFSLDSSIPLPLSPLTPHSFLYLPQCLFFPSLFFYPFLSFDSLNCLSFFLPFFLSLFVDLSSIFCLSSFPILSLSLSHTYTHTLSLSSSSSSSFDVSVSPFSFHFSLFPPFVCPPFFLLSLLSFYSNSSFPPLSLSSYF